MYPLVRVDKRIPDGSIWQRWEGYLLPAVNGWTRVLGPAGTRWSNPQGGWTTEHDGISLVRPDRPFTISCHGPDDQKCFYVDVAHRMRVEPNMVEFEDLFLDVMIDAEGAVSEKDEHQLVVLAAVTQAFARVARDEVRLLIRTGDPLFDASSPYYGVPEDAAHLAPSREAFELD